MQSILHANKSLDLFRKERAFILVENTTSNTKTDLDAAIVIRIFSTSRAITERLGYCVASLQYLNISKSLK